MYSLVILFSNDRLEQLQIMMNCWRQQAEGFEDCEKILVVDGKLIQKPEGDWTVLEIQRNQAAYCWADTLNAGVQAATKQIVFYYDSDRIISRGHVQYCLETLYQEAAYVYTPKLFSFHAWPATMSIEQLCQAADRPDEHRSTMLYPDFRVSDPEHYEHKNPFSGGVAFRKETFLDHGGFDRRFIGYGYPDFDFFMNTTRRGAKFVQAPGAELHMPHLYLAGDRMVALHNAWNCWQYVMKWDLDRTFVDGFWKKLNIPMAARGCHDLNEFLACV